MIRWLTKRIGDDARRRLENGRRIGFEIYGQDQGVYEAVPPIRWYHVLALTLELKGHKYREYWEDTKALLSWALLISFALLSAAFCVFCIYWTWVSR